MRYSSLLLAAFLAAFTLTGCSGDVPDLLSPDDSSVLFHHRPDHAGGPGGGGGGGGDDPEDPEDPGDDGQNLATSWEILALLDGEPTAITGDGRAGGPYVDGECGVSSIVNVEGGSDDALLRTDWRRIHPRDGGTCDGRDPRVFTVDLSAAVEGAPDRGTVEGTFGNINRVGRVAPGEVTTDFGAAFNLSGCNLRMGVGKDGEPWPGTDEVEIAAGTNDEGVTVWTVRSTGQHRAMCVTDFETKEGDLYVVPFHIVIADLERDPAF